MQITIMNKVCTFYAHSPADGVTPFPHAVAPNGTVFVRLPNLVWRKQNDAEKLLWSKGVARLL